MKRKHVLLISLLFPTIAIQLCMRAFGPLPGALVGLLGSCALWAVLWHLHIRWVRIRILEIVERRADGFNGRDVGKMLYLKKPPAAFNALVESGHLEQVMSTRYSEMQDGVERTFEVYRAVMTDKGREELARYRAERP